MDDSWRKMADAVAQREPSEDRRTSDTCASWDATALYGDSKPVSSARLFVFGSRIAQGLHGENLPSRVLWNSMSLRVMACPGSSSSLIRPPQ